MKKILAMVVAAMMALSFSMVVVAAEEKTEKTEKVEKKDVKKGKKDKKDKKDKSKDDEAKPAAKGKKEVSGC